MSSTQINEAFIKTEKALQALKQMLDRPMQDDRGNIDAAIQRFEFTIELFWKLLKRILASKGLDVIYPKDVLQQAYKGSLIDNEQLWIAMLRDRNLTSHTYNEELADQIFKNLYTYYPELKKTFEQLKAQYCR
jgi:nucleotidyltransferase substrate binding protein (TIGR01987 family)